VNANALIKEGEKGNCKAKTGGGFRGFSCSRKSSTTQKGVEEESLKRTPTIRCFGKKRQQDSAQGEGSACPASGL